MSISKLARSGRIDKHYNDINSEFDRLNSQMQALIRKARLAAAFMYDNPDAEFEQQDIDKYKSLFLNSVSSPNGFLGTQELLQPLIDVNQGLKTQAEFISEETGYNAVDFSAQFDKG